MNAIETSGLEWRAGSFRLGGLDLEVPEGSIYGFLGPNGSGKTTTIRLLLGMARPLAGTIRLLGDPVPGAMPRILARTGYVPERSHLYDHLTVAEAAAYHAAHYATWDDAWSRRLAAGFRLPADARIRTLSKGEVGKLMILLALAQRPELLVLDEPTDGLDPVARREVFEALLEYVSESGATVFISSHLVHELERICDEVGVIDGGALVAQLPMRAFKEDVKRLGVVDAPSDDAGAPFTVLARRAADAVGPGETWVVRGWSPDMAGWVEGAGGRVRDVVDLDLEEAFVELLSSARAAPREVA